MYRVRLQYARPYWAYYRRCQGIARYAPPDFKVDMGAWHPCAGRDDWPEDAQYDLVFQLVPDHEALRRFLEDRGQSDTLILAGLNVGWGHHEKRLEMCRAADHIVVNNYDLWERLEKPKGMTWISNGVDLNTFRVTTPPAQRKQKVLWTGCEHHCRETNIKGWHEVLLPLMFRLEEAQIDCDFRVVKADRPEEGFDTQQMVAWYNSGTIYVCASSSEGTPNPALEAAACGCIVVSTRVGNMPELIEHDANGELVNRDIDELESAVYRCQDNYLQMVEAMQERIARWDWSRRAPFYYELFRQLIDGRCTKST